MKKALCFVAFAAVTLVGLRLDTPAMGKRERFALELKACQDARAGGKPGKCALFGKIKYVENFPDVTVKVVENFPDIKVKLVDNFPDKPGMWKIVNDFPDYKVKIVENFPDYKIKFVQNFPDCK